MGMVGEKGPCVADGICSGQQIGETIHHVIAVFVVSEYLPAFNAANHGSITRFSTKIYEINRK